MIYKNVNKKEGQYSVGKRTNKAKHAAEMQRIFDGFGNEKSQLNNGKYILHEGDYIIHLVRICSEFLITIYLVEKITEKNVEVHKIHEKELPELLQDSLFQMKNESSKS